MNIGDKVRVLAVVSFYYDDDNIRKYERTPDDFVAFITGAANKPLGQYYPANRYSSLNGVEWEPAELVVKGTLKVFRVRKRLFGREYDVHPNDLVKIPCTD